MTQPTQTAKSGSIDLLFITSQAKSIFTASSLGSKPVRLSWNGKTGEVTAVTPEGDVLLSTTLDAIDSASVIPSAVLIVIGKEKYHFQLQAIRSKNNILNDVVDFVDTANGSILTNAASMNTQLEDLKAFLGEKLVRKTLSAKTNLKIVVIAGVIFLIILVIGVVGSYIIGRFGSI